MAAKKFAQVETGLSAQYVGEIVEVDEWKIDVLSMFAESGLLAGLSKEQLKSVEVGRRWLYLAIDVASRCIVGIRISERPNAEDATSLLQQIMRDKTAISTAVGCKNEWKQHCGVAQILTDQGAAFIAPEFRTAVSNLEWSRGTPPAGKPFLRGHVERVFRTFATQLMPLLTARVHSNIEERGDYPSEDYAGLSDDDLIDIFVRFIVDIYHQTPHASLPGETPSEAWDRLSKTMPTIPVPNELQEVITFGKHYTRKNSPSGLQQYAIRYACDESRTANSLNPIRDLELAILDRDISKSAIKIDSKWYTAKPVQTCFEGMDLEIWSRIRAGIRHKSANTIEVNSKELGRAYSEISNVDRRACERARLLPKRMSDAQIQHYYEDQFVGLSVSTPIHESELAATGDGLPGMVISGSVDEDTGHQAPTKSGKPSKEKYPKKKKLNPNTKVSKSKKAIKKSWRFDDE